MLRALPVTLNSATGDNRRNLSPGRPQVEHHSRDPHKVGLRKRGRLNLVNLELLKEEPLRAELHRGEPPRLARPRTSNRYSGPGSISSASMRL